MEFLESLAALGQNGDIAVLCEQAGAPASACRVPFSSGAAADRPGGRPVVITSEPVEPMKTNPNPGRLLTVCGVDGDGNRYAGNVLVYRDDDGLMTPYPVFWAGIPIALVEPGVSPTTAAGGANPLMAQCEAANAFD